MATVEEFIAKFANLFDETDISQITLETEFESLDEWSSLLALSVMAMVAEEYDVMITANQMEQSRKVVDVYNIINSAG